MPIMKVVAVRDRAIDGFMQPLFVNAIGQGIRVFSDAVNDKQTPIHAHPEDYDLYEIGMFDTDTGEIQPVKPRQIAIGKDQVRSENV